MKMRIIAILSLAALVLLGSCEFALGRQAEGTLTFYFGTGSSARAYSDAPFDGLPVFSSVTVTVSGTGMTTASRTVSGTAGRVTLQVPAGASRRVEVYAVPDWAETQLQLPDVFLPTLAKAYGGTAVVDVAGGETVNVSMKMSVVETKILLPDPYNNGNVFTAESLQAAIDGPSVLGVGGYSYFAFDRFGRLYFSTDSALRWVDSIPGTPTDILTTGSGLNNSPSGLAIDNRNNRLFWVEQGEGSELYFLDMTSDSPFATQLFEGDSSFNGNAVAVDSEGYVYIGAYRYSSESDGIAKLRIVFNGETMEAELAGFATYEALDLGYWVTSGETYFQYLSIEDMTVKDDKLYIAAGEHWDEVHHGKIVEARLSDLAKQREFGWSGTTPIPNPQTQFYGPTRFLAIAPRKLIVSDEGNDGSERDRAVEVDLDTGSLSGIRDLVEVDFFNTYGFIAH